MYIDNLTASYVDKIDSDLDIQNYTHSIILICDSWSTRYYLIIFCIESQR